MLNFFRRHVFSVIRVHEDMKHVLVNNVGQFLTVIWDGVNSVDTPGLLLSLTHFQYFWRSLSELCYLRLSQKKLGWQKKEYLSRRSYWRTQLFCHHLFWPLSFFVVLNPDRLSIGHKSEQKKTVSETNFFRQCQLDRWISNRLDLVCHPKNGQRHINKNEYSKF